MMFQHVDHYEDQLFCKIAILQQSLNSRIIPMKPLDPEFAQQSKVAFITGNVPSMAEIQRRADEDAGLAPTKRRDLSSAIRRFEAMSGVPAERFEGTAGRVRAAFERANPARLGISEKTFANSDPLVGYFERALRNG